MNPTPQAVQHFVSAGWTPSQLEAQGYMKDGAPTPAILEALRTGGWSDDMLTQNGLATASPAGETVAPEVKPDAKVCRYLDLRDETVRISKQQKEAIEPLKEEMVEIELELSGVLQSVNQTSMKSDSGTFFFTDKNYVKVVDYVAFQRWFLGTLLNRLAAKGFIAAGKNSSDAIEALMDSIGLNFLTQAVRKEAVVEYVSEHGEAPPGLSTETVQEVQVRRPTIKK